MDMMNQGWMDEWMDGKANGWMDGRMDGWNGWLAAEKDMEMELILEVFRTGLG